MRCALPTMPIARSKMRSKNDTRPCWSLPTRYTRPVWYDEIASDTRLLDSHVASPREQLFSTCSLVRSSGGFSDCAVLRDSFLDSGAAGACGATASAACPAALSVPAVFFLLA